MLNKLELMCFGSGQPPYPTRNVIVGKKIIPSEIIHLIVAHLLKETPSITFPALYSLWMTSRALKLVMGSIECIKPLLKIQNQKVIMEHREKPFKMTDQEEINRIIAKYASSFSQQGLEIYNDYGKALVILGQYCSLYSDTSTNFHWTCYSENTMQLCNFFNGNLQNNHKETVKSVLRSRPSGNMYCGIESPWGDSSQVMAVLNDLKMELLRKNYAFNPNGKLATSINDIQKLCKVYCIDVHALSKNIEAKNGPKL